MKNEIKQQLLKIDFSKVNFFVKDIINNEKTRKNFKEIEEVKDIERIKAKYKNTPPKCFKELKELSSIFKSDEHQKEMKVLQENFDKKALQLKKELKALVIVQQELKEKPQSFINRQNDRNIKDKEKVLINDVKTIEPHLEEMKKEVKRFNRILKDDNTLKIEDKGR